MSTQSATTNRKLLTAVAALLSVNIAVNLANFSTPAAANAAGPNDPPMGFPNNAAVQQRQLEALTEISAKLGRLESKMDKGFNVKVTEMPEIKFPQTTDASNGK